MTRVFFLLPVAALVLSCASPGQLKQRDALREDVEAVTRTIKQLEAQLPVLEERRVATRKLKEEIAGLEEDIAALKQGKDPRVGDEQPPPSTLTPLMRKALLNPNTTFLSFRNTGLKSVPPRIASLKKLRELDLSYTDVVTLPREIGSLGNLEVLDLSYSEIERLPGKEMAQLKKLKRLDLTGTEISAEGRKALRSWLPKNCKVLP